MKRLINKSIVFANMPKEYAQLVQMFQLRPITNRKTLACATRIADAMAGHNLSQDQADYFAVLVTLMEQYEKAHLPQPNRKHDHLGNLQFLMEQNQMNTLDLGRILGQRKLGSKMLLKKRPLSKMFIIKLADHFKVNPAYFL